MRVYKAYKFRLYPTFKQKDFFNRCFGCCRYVYNWALWTKMNAYKNEKKALSITKDISPMLPKFKEENSFLKDVDSVALISELNNLKVAYQRFFKKDNKHPKFKKNENYCCYYTRLIKNALNLKK